MHFKPINSFIIILCDNKTLIYWLSKYSIDIKRKWHATDTYVEIISVNYEIENWTQCKLSPTHIECIISELLYKLVFPLQCTLCTTPKVRPFAVCIMSWCLECWHMSNVTVIFNKVLLSGLSVLSQCYNKHICNIAFS